MHAENSSKTHQHTMGKYMKDRINIETNNYWHIINENCLFWLIIRTRPQIESTNTLSTSDILNKLSCTKAAGSPGWPWNNLCFTVKCWIKLIKQHRIGWKTQKLWSKNENCSGRRLLQPVNNFIFSLDAYCPLHQFDELMMSILKAILPENSS
jgi:hypothetical protein